VLLEFDEAKSAKNLKRRGIGFERFADIDTETAVSGEDVRKDYGERRLRVLGFIDDLLHAAVVTPRGEKIRVISLRRANRREERAYAKERQSS
jgi:uncharacterized DUF497 family protein